MKGVESWINFLNQVADKLKEDIKEFPFGLRIILSPNAKIEGIEIESLERRRQRREKDIEFDSFALDKRCKIPDEKEFINYTKKEIMKYKEKIKAIKEITDALNFEEQFIIVRDRIEFLPSLYLDTINWKAIEDTKRFIKNFKQIFSQAILKNKIINNLSVGKLIRLLYHQFGYPFSSLLKELIKEYPSLPSQEEIFKQTIRNYVKERIRQLKLDIKELSRGLDKVKEVLKSGKIER